MPALRRPTKRSSKNGGYKDKSQSATEFIITYGWAILILSIVLASLFLLNLFNPSTFAPNYCIFQASFSCQIITLPHTNGYMNVSIGQALDTPINVTAIGCNQQGTVTNMTSYMPASNNIYLGIGGNYTFTSIPCYQNGAVISGPAGTLYAGYIVMQYTNLETGLQHTATAKVSQKLT